MKTIKVKHYLKIPDYFTGIAELPDGIKIYFKNGLRHREDGLPALEYSNGTKVYYFENKLHRIGGPAYVSTITEEYWIYDKQVSKEAHDLLYNIMLLKGLIK